MSRNNFLKLLLIFSCISVAIAGFFIVNNFKTLYSESLEGSVLSSITGNKIIFKKLNKVPKKDEAFLLFVGDIMLDRGVAYVAKKNNDLEFPFLKSAEDLRSADLTIGNLEGPISLRGTRSGSIYSFRFDPKVVTGLQLSGFDVLSLANNHIFDYGRTALLDTITHLNDAGISSTGAGANFDEANRPALREVNGQKFAFLSFTTLYPSALYASTSRPGISKFNPSSTVELIKELKNEKIFVTVLMHWGDEYSEEPNEGEKNSRQLSLTLVPT